MLCLDRFRISNTCSRYDRLRKHELKEAAAGTPDLRSHFLRVEIDKAAELEKCGVIDTSTELEEHAAELPESSFRSSADDNDCTSI